jgi:hypothetical protein
MVLSKERDSYPLISVAVEGNHPNASESQFQQEICIPALDYEQS